ncbi:hypothetical protein [Actinocrispum wychmicini]|uniref:Uncharacterized protein n=1 Tax=Actinocrispum wychmicini TaxID=1213861 RepID=A0A4R2JHL3_9PSEU|nr:hypothetical protein [Actinocrispum wychmicini]TCO58207.1 hypothetical protein EV192_105272 [Actinocrispum wychmicini]
MPVQASLLPAPIEQADPLAKVTLAPRTFAAVLFLAALVVGLVLVLIPVRVSTLDTTKTTKVSCGNILGGVETPQVASALGQPTDEMVLAQYVHMCEDSTNARTYPAWGLFFAGLAGCAWLVTVRRKTA